MTERTPLHDIGELRISLSDRSFFFKPSFAAMARIGNGTEIVEIYAKLNGIDYVPVIQAFNALPSGAQEYVAKAVSKPVYGRHVLTAAYIILQACCEDDISVLIGGWKPTSGGVRYIPGIMPVADIITIARDLIEHGVIGKSPLKVPQRAETNKKTTNDFNISQYIISARTHFGISREEAEDLSMTEFQQMIKNKFPEPAGVTREQHKELYDDAKVMRDKIAERRKAQQRKQESSR